MQAEILEETNPLVQQGAVPIAIAMVSMSIDDLAYEVALLRTAVTGILENTKELARIADNLTLKQ